MGFFDDLGKMTTEATNKLTDTTNKLTKEAKLKMKMSENKGKIKSLYEEIGRKVYEKHVREENIDINELVKEDCASIDSLSKEIEDARKEVLTLSNKKMCKNCFAELDKNAQFCSKCGEKQNEEKTVFEKAEEKLENAEIKPENQKEAEIVKEELEEKIEKE